ncbi:MAG: DUF4422 domain-containing protein [Bacteroidales bacterium]|nr:DUF4422 domain-containing protein [Bacteroidales bacterium]MCM1415018.1 DUF4422 domain-containing protein [bacterium]MCM1422872.1 DUF4422 domain-containing protein [bacterium]
MSVTIFTMTHKKFPTPGDPVYVPLQVGRAGAADLGYIGDDTGVSISEKNCYYGELTGIYWVWKNIRTSDYVGICHYRRYFCTEEGRILTARDYEEILSSHDIITSKLLKLNFSYYEGYAGDYNIRDLEAVGEVIRKDHPAYYETFERLVQGKGTYFGNMMVCKKELYDAYCAWLFDIFEKAEEKIDASGYDDYHKRVYGFISEFLLYVWTQVQGLKVYECKVGMTDEKRETAESKEKLAAYFAKKDIAGAKAYLLQCLTKRPDVLMEASDITGELKLSMQVIAVCELEQEAYGSSTIDRIQAFDALMAHFRKLNDIIQGIKAGETKLSPPAVEFLRKEAVTEIALEASARLFGTPEEAKRISDIALQTLFEE